MVPFNLPIDTEKPLYLGAIRIPRYGSVTVMEAIALERIIEENKDLLQDRAVAEAIALFHLQPTLATLLLISRHSHEWTLERVKAELAPKQITEACEFLLGERRRWKDTPPKAEGRPLEWEEIFWRLALHYPQEQRFSSGEFWRCPLSLIDEALAAIEQQELEAANRAAIAISALGCAILATHGQQADPAMFNPFAQLLDQQQAKAEIPPEVARTFLELSTEGRVPAWVLGAVDVQKIRMAAR